MPLALGLSSQGLLHGMPKLRNEVAVCSALDRCVMLGRGAVLQSGPGTCNDSLVEVKGSSRMR